MIRDFRKPLVVMTPKSLLRHPKVVSTMEELANGKFQELLDDPVIKAKNKVEKLVFLSGKLYYDIDKERDEHPTEKVAVIRLEQLYPLPDEQIRKIRESYPNATKVVWAQEEPRNMGGAYYIKMNFPIQVDEIISPAASASPAPGSSKAFAVRQQNLVESILKV
jgi:2-oxoglutarate dehydrogenase E1 component